MLLSFLFFWGNETLPASIHVIVRCDACDVQFIILSTYMHACIHTHTHMPCCNSPEVVSKTKHSKTKTEARSTQISKTKHPNLENEAPKTRKRSTLDRKRRPQNLENEAPKTRKRRPLNLENEAPKTRNHCRFNKCNFTSYMTQSKEGGGSGCVRTSKGPQNPSQGFNTNCFTERF